MPRNGAPARSARQAAEPGAGVEHERRRLAVVVRRSPRTRCGRRSGRTRRPARASTLGPRRGGSSAASRRRLLWRWPSPARPEPRGRSGRRVATATRHGGDRPAASPCERPPRAAPARRATAPGPELGAAGSPSTSTRRRRRAAGTARRPGLPCSTSTVALLQLPDLGLLPAAHDRGRQLALERRLHRGDQRRRVLVAPRGVLAEGGFRPVLEVGDADSSSRGAGAS